MLARNNPSLRSSLPPSPPCALDSSGLTINPYPLDGSKFVLSSGGSSGGSAVAVASHIAPIAVSEDTAGSTRHPAACCCLFGYDPPRNKHPNDGNPGMTYYNDQVGCIARSLDDIIVYDAAVCGTAAEHAAAAAAVKKRANKSIRVAFPEEIFVRFASEPGGSLVEASDETRARLSRCRECLVSAGFAVLANGEWPRVASKRFGGEKVNALLHHLFGEEWKPGGF